MTQQEDEEVVHRAAVPIAIFADAFAARQALTELGIKF
jgi:hypothetical protein